MEAKELLKKIYGYDSFRPGQETIIDAIMNKRDCLAIMPTGAGKSICYQIPALLLEGITLVISPLISLMQDQVTALNSVGIHAAYINSQLTDNQITKALELATKGQYKIIYVAPERLESAEFVNFAKNVRISMITVDEAHCISQWGQDFRPGYLKIAEFIEKLSTRPIVSAFTATATMEVKEDIVNTLHLNDPEVLVTGFDRPNLFFRVERTRLKDDFVLSFVKEHKEESGIIYCATRKNVDKLFELMTDAGVEATKYHAGLDNEYRKQSQSDFIYDMKPVIVATNAFGMGIDKSNVRYVIHYNMPQSVENYYQEAGRAGRDGEEAICVLLFSPQDVVIDKMLIENKESAGYTLEMAQEIKLRDLKRLRIMEDYCTTTRCLRNYLLEYFGEKTAGACNNCSNCCEEFYETDMTDAAKWVINCVAETKGRFGIATVDGTLRGRNRAKLREIGAMQYKSYGKLSELSREQVRQLIETMLQEDYLLLTEGEYSVLQMGKAVTKLHDESVRVIVRTRKQIVPMGRQKGKGQNINSLTATGLLLFEELRKLRREIALEAGTPPYIVFSDKALIDMCLKVPTNEEQMLNVSGVGAVKFERYGEQFLAVIQQFCEKHVGEAIVTKSADLQETPNTEKRRKGRKTEFALSKSEAQNFQYAELLLLQDIKEQMNSICGEDKKPITIKAMFNYLQDLGYVSEKYINGIWRKVISERGQEIGIREIEKQSKNATIYKELIYPEKIQHLLVEYYTSDNGEETVVEQQNRNEEKTNASGERSQEAYVPWTKEEEDKLLDEFSCDMPISKIAQMHGRSEGGIRARLKKMGIL